MQETLTCSIKNKENIKDMEDVYMINVMKNKNPDWAFSQLTGVVDIAELSKRGSWSYDEVRVSFPLSAISLGFFFSLFDFHPIHVQSASSSMKVITTLTILLYTHEY